MKSFITWREQLEGDTDLKIEKIGQKASLATIHLKDLQKTGGLAYPASQLFYHAVLELEEITKIVDSLRK